MIAGTKRRGCKGGALSRSRQHILALFRLSLIPSTRFSLLLSPRTFSLWVGQLTVLHLPPTTSTQLHPHPSRIPPILRMRLPRLEYSLQPQRLYSIHNFPRQRIRHRVLLAHAAAMLACACSIKIDGVEAVIGLVVGWRGGGVERAG